MLDLSVALTGWLLVGGVATVATVRRVRADRDAAAVLVAYHEVVSFRELMERARAEQDADPATALFVQRYRTIRLAARWPQLARIARGRELTSRRSAG